MTPQFIMSLAEEASKESKCNSRKVGCVIIDADKHIMVTGCNGSDCNFTTCLRADSEIGENLQSCRSMHAEVDAITRAMKLGLDLSNCYLYCTLHPCCQCAALINSVNILGVFYRDSYPSSKAARAILNRGSSIVRKVSICGIEGS